jgi:hypothetical protein
MEPSVARSRLRSVTTVCLQMVEGSYKPHIRVLTDDIATNAG